jgi:hypothetical protein
MPGKPKPMITRTGGRGNEGNVTLFSKVRSKSDDDNKKKFNPRTGEETDKPRGKGPRTIYRPKPDIQTPQMRTGGLSPKQKKIAAKAPPPDKIDAKDFAVLKAEKAKGRGMGLQDEKIKPGKVMKANKGKMTPLKKDPTTPVNPFEKRRKQLGGGKLKALGRVMGSRAALLGAVGAGAVAGLNMAGKKLKEFADKKKDKKMGGGMMKKYSKGGGADTGRIGEMKSKISVAMDRASRRSRDKDRLTTRDKEEAINIIRRRSRNEDRITDRDMESASSAIKGYTSGGKAKKSKPASPQSKPENKYNSGPDLRPDPDILGNRYQNKVEKYYGSKEAELHSGYKNDKRPFPDLGEDRAEKRAMKEVLQEAGIKFKTGGSVMARGCKLGRNKKTKLY